MSALVVVNLVAAGRTMLLITTGSADWVCGATGPINSSRGLRQLYLWGDVRTQKQRREDDDDEESGLSTSVRKQWKKKRMRWSMTNVCYGLPACPVLSCDHPASHRKKRADDDGGGFQYYSAMNSPSAWKVRCRTWSWGARQRRCTMFIINPPVESLSQLTSE